MLKQKIISSEELSNYGEVASLNEQAFALVKQQVETWELARDNYGALSKVESKKFTFEHFQIIAQHNSERMRSSAAKVDAKSIAERPCFLCRQNLPKEQKALFFQNKFLILVNPFPVFPVHLTIPLIEHLPQQIYNYFPDMLELARALDGFTVFYNGPQSGASAPDHFHFQAGNRGFLPIENELDNLERSFSEVLIQKEGLKIIAVKNYFRKFVCINSSSLSQALTAFQRLYTLLPEKNGNEPKLNILCWFENGEWRVNLFPREKLRPSHFYETGNSQVVVSPAAVELGGIMVLPRHRDFEYITSAVITEVYNEVSFSEIHFERWIKSFANAFR